MKKNMLAGFILTCVGDDRAFSYMPSRRGDTIADNIARLTLARYAPDFVTYDFLRDRGSDERQYCSPGADLPVVSVMRTKYGRYPEYHTSKDNLTVISAQGFAKSFHVYLKMFENLERTTVWQAVNVGEPQLSKRNYRDAIGGQRGPLADRFRLISDVLATADGRMDNLTLATLTGRTFEDIERVCEMLAQDGLVRRIL
jgi:aminopeptidase-like protein